MRNSFWRSALASGLIWTIMWIMLRSMEHKSFTQTILWTSILEGLFMGICWALIMKLMSSDPFKHVRLDLGEGESVIKESGAYLMTGRKGEGGKLALTDIRLLFKGQRYDTRHFQNSFELEKIKDLRAVKSWFLLKNEVHFKCEGSSLQFAVDDADAWVNAVERQAASIPLHHIA